MTDGPQRHYPPPGAPPPPESPQAYPPPGAPARPEAPPAGTPPPPPAAWPQLPPPGGPHAGGPRPGMALGAAHKPGAFPLRPLDLGAIYDGAFRIIRFNPKATVGAAVLVTAAAMLVPVVVTAILSFTVGLAVDASGEIEADADTGELVGLLVAYGSQLLSVALAQVGVLLVTGMVAHVVRAAAVGRRIGLADAWAATLGNRWRLIGLGLLLNLGFLLILVAYVLAWVVVVVLFDVLLVVLWGLASVPAFIALCAWLWVRAYYLAVPALMLDNAGVFGAIGRGWTLTGRNFWRVFGVALLTFAIGLIGGSMLAVPITLVGSVVSAAVPDHALLAIVVAQGVATVVQYAFLAPFSASVSTMQYVDLRIRKEAFDVDLMREAGLIPS